MSQQKQKKISLPLYIISVIIALIVGGAGVFYYQEKQKDSLSHSVISQEQLAKNFSSIEELYQILSTQYVEPVEQKKLIEGALAGMAAGTGDPYTEYLNEDVSTNLNEEMTGSFQGIGTEVTKEGKQLKVVAPISGSPAEKAGILANDVIVAVDDKAVAGMSINEAVDLIRGKEGATVTLTILRDGEQFNVSIKRAEIPVETVHVEKDPEYSNIAHIKITKFSDTTAKDLKKALKSLKKEKINSVVLDVRNNPGGVLGGVLEIANMFVPDGQPLMQSKERGQKEPIVYNASEELGTYKYDGQIVLLVDEGSASASEILAGALKSIKVPIIGQKTFGKGTIQTVQPLELSKGELKYTMGYWLTANGDPINKKGIKPDIEVTLDIPDHLFAINTEKKYQLDDINSEVENIKRILSFLDYDVNATNIYDEATQTSIEAFQKEQKLPVTGTVDGQTASALTEAVRHQIKAKDTQYHAAVSELAKMNKES